MNRFLVIADDLTGAAEIGGIGVQFGLTARIICGEFVNRHDANLLVINTDSRHLQPVHAMRNICRALRGCDPSKFDLIYKKTDSILRGAVAAEIDAMLRTLNRRKAILAPQNPTLGRVIRNGRYFVHSIPLHKTDFANDPEHPRHTSRARDLLGRHEREIRIVSAESTQELKALASKTRAGILPAGGADFFTAHLIARGLKPGNKRVKIDTGDEELFVCGSASAPSRRAIRKAQGRGIIVSPMPQQLAEFVFRDARAMRTWADQVCGMMQSGGKVVMAVGEQTVRGEARRVREIMAAVVAKVLRERRPETLWIEGGATAAAILCALKWRQLAVEGTLAPGVVALRAIERENQRLILKPGSYAWPKRAL
jgi:uncharacterized protein YgbK (DUF1537 family)